MPSWHPRRTNIFHRHNMDPYIVVAIFWMHFLGDFIFQTDQMAINKSKNSWWLFYHVATYCVFLMPFGALFLNPLRTFLFVLLNYIAHFATDYVTSRITTRLFHAGKRHAFFVVIGVDQALHMTMLVMSYYWISLGRLDALQEMLWRGAAALRSLRP